MSRPHPFHPTTRGEESKERVSYAWMLQRFPDRVCARWKGSFERFLTDLGPRPSWAHVLTLVDPAGDYVPGNVYWGPVLTPRPRAR